MDEINDDAKGNGRGAWPRIRTALKVAGLTVVAMPVLYIASAIYSFHMIDVRDNISAELRQTIEPYVTKNLERVIAENDRKTNTTHRGLPRIEFFRREHSILDIFKTDEVEAIGTYDSDTNTVALLIDGAVTPEDTILNRMAKGFGVAEFDVKRTLDHELGHWKTDILCEKMGWPHWMHDKSEGLRSDVLRNSIINEGIARYFEHKANGGLPFFYSSAWPKDYRNRAEMKEFKDRGLYSAGCWLVAPILDKYGEEGMMYLITHPLSRSDLYSPIRYQRRAMRQLSLIAKERHVRSHATN